jgi:hypothetical protein
MNVWIFACRTVADGVTPPGAERVCDKISPRSSLAAPGPYGPPAGLLSR